MSITITVDANYLANPPDSGQSPEYGALRIRETRKAQQERLAVEHFGTTSETQSKHGLHREGSAIAYHIINTSLPSTRPDGVTALTTDDAGRICFKLEAPITSGTATGTTANKLVAAGDTFETDGVRIGNIVYNTTDNTRCFVSAIDSETQLSLDEDIMANAETYSIYASYVCYIWDGYEWIEWKAMRQDTHSSLTTCTISLGTNWNMDITGGKNFAHPTGVTRDNIRRLFAMIANDDGTASYSLTDEGNGSLSSNNTAINVSRKTGGFFDGPNFDDTSVNRGYLTIEYDSNA